MARNLYRAAAVAVAAVVVFLAVGPVSAATPDPKLLARFQPVTQFDPAEPFGPTSVQSFITDSSLERSDGTNWVVVDPDPDPGDLPGPGTGIWRLNQNPCTPGSALGGLECYTDSWNQGAGSSTVYGRVAHQDGQTILQYWYFYYDDVYSYYYPFEDILWQAHEGDWEVVNVVLDEDEQPLSVGYSQHCLGQQRDWAHTSKWDGTHPIVYVALGSHANYFTSGKHQFNLACIPDPVKYVLFNVLHIPIPDDYTGEGKIAGPPQSGGTVTHIDKIGGGAHSWVAFPGFWGEGEFFFAAPIGLGPVLAGTSPEGPAGHEVWTDPLGTLATWPPG